ncbi:MAG: hypothetical protein ACXIUV_12775 [Alkalilacustris sp.]
MSDTSSRAEAARRKILESGDPDLIKRLQLLEATAPRRADGGPAPTPQGSALPGMLGLGLAAAGGAWLGTVLGGIALSREMEQAFSEVAAGMGLDADFAGLGGDAEPIEASQDAGDDLFGGLDDFFDI